MPPPRYLIVAGIVRQAEKILLVKQQGADDAFPTWALPGGVVEQGELLTEALAREVLEETGLEVIEVGSLVYATQLDNRKRKRQSIVFVFEVNQWRGVPGSNDPDDLIQDVAFVSPDEAIAKLSALPWRIMKEPILAYLKGDTGFKRVWLYRNDGQWEEPDLVAVL